MTTRILSASLDLMTHAAPTPGGFDEYELSRILHQACQTVGLSPAHARLLRGHTNAVILLEDEHVVVKVARKGPRAEEVARTVAFVRWLMDTGFPTAPLHPVQQPVSIDGHAVSFWTYLPQTAAAITAAELAKPLYALHTLPVPPIDLPAHDNLSAIRRSIKAITCLPDGTLEFLTAQADQLAQELAEVEFFLAPGVIQGDPQHRNALHTADQDVVLCDWDTVALGQPEWDLVTVEVHCRRFGYGEGHYAAFAEAYGWDVTTWPGYQTLTSIRELRMISTNARKVPTHAPASLTEIERRIEGLQRGDRSFQWSIL
ncbi:phosphotransferase [Streptomyces sp. NPDC001941]|uniref:phosphotransferase family protein n=1 Tax=Streptomyces sp. NPDC001941 TaxID=3154659 RepID=UPI003321454C